MKYTKRLFAYGVSALLVIFGALFISRVAEAQNATNVIYADQDYLDVTIEEKQGSYLLDIKSKNLRAVDWVGYVSRLDPQEFRSVQDFNLRTKNLRSDYDNEGEKLGIVYAEAKSFFRYFDVLKLAINTAIDKVFGETFEDTVSVPTDKKAVYLVRSFSGSWGKLTDPEERVFIQSRVYEGKKRDENALVLNLTTAGLDAIGILIPFADFSTTELSEMTIVAINAGLKGFSRMGEVPDLKDFMEITVEVAGAILDKTADIVKKQASSNLFKFLGKSSKMLIGLVDAGEKISKGGMIIDRATQMLLTATPLETAYFITGEPLAGFSTETVQKIAYVGTDNNIWLIDANGDNKEKLTNTGRAFHPQISPDGRYVLYLDNDDIYKWWTKEGTTEEFDIFLLEVSTKKTKKIASGAIPKWLPDSANIFFLEDLILSPEYQRGIKINPEAEAYDIPFPTGKIAILDIETMEKNYPLDDEVTFVLPPQFLPNGSFFISDKNYTEFVLVSKKGDKKKIDSFVDFYAVSPDGKRAVVHNSPPFGIESEEQAEMYKKALEAGEIPTQYTMIDNISNNKQRFEYIGKDFTSVIPNNVCNQEIDDETWEELWIKGPKIIVLSSHYGHLFWDSKDRIFHQYMTGRCDNKIHTSLLASHETGKPSFLADMGATGGSIALYGWGLSPDRNQLVYMENFNIEVNHTSFGDIIVLNLTDGSKRKIVEGKNPSW